MPLSLGIGKLKGDSEIAALVLVLDEAVAELLLDTVAELLLDEAVATSVRARFVFSSHLNK